MLKIRTPRQFDLRGALPVRKAIRGPAGMNIIPCQNSYRQYPVGLRSKERACMGCAEENTVHMPSRELIAGFSAIRRKFQATVTPYALVQNGKPSTRQEGKGGES